MIQFTCNRGASCVPYILSQGSRVKRRSEVSAGISSQGQNFQFKERGDQSTKGKRLICLSSLTQIPSKTETQSEDEVGLKI